ncbi:hypothetical protein DM02DRAFT_593087 [Periconia macrospinosa]|uniref:Probable methionine--tRNA ligase, mitochondrial n=1 Tax=Periconia macrospinosa TaxID=97972 RepID=A0A2V1DQ80_9PLEO|nr:hypothetical protein DM02DRAFT_593087 [Periconia macrospinosa]
MRGGVGRMRSRIHNLAAPTGRRLYSSLSRTNLWVCRASSIQAIGTRHLSTNRKPFYITTPIFYVNAAPHVGHLYTMVLADIIKRWEVLKGEKALLCTGTDEHGLKVQRAAAKAGIEPKLFCDDGATIFKQLAQKALLTNDHFVRTSDREHKDAVEYAWLLLKEKGYIYTEKHEGWYSVTDEAFYPQSGVRPYLDPPTGRKMMTSIETGSEVEWSSETNYHFRLSSFRDRLLEFYKANPEWITPEHRMKEVIQSVESGLEDLSISRPSSRLTWGIGVPGDSSQTIYVWLDALMNYATKAGYPWTPGRDHEGGWPADCHVIGKDIVRFHCIYWPAFLMALGLPLPKRILTHAHWTLGGNKMSKSTGRVVDPFLALDRYGPDVMRFYLAHDGGIQDDANYNNISIIKAYNTFLNGNLGNLASRVTRGKKWSVRGAVERMGPVVPKEWAVQDEDSEDYFYAPGRLFYENTLLKMPLNITKALDDLDPRTALAEIVELARRSNQFFHQSAPWSKILPFAEGEPGEDVDRIVYLASESLRIMGILLMPYMPNKAGMLLDQLGVDKSRRTHQYCKVNADLDYGTPMISLGKGYEGALFPPLSSEE